MTDAPHVRITDPRALKALAHPARNRILGHLQVNGPATATECADVAGMSPSACSYHLRLLKRYGFVEEERDETRTDGRERLWKATIRGWTTDLADDVDPAEAQAIDMAMARVLLDSSDEKVLAWTDAQAAQPKEWREASLISNGTIVATPEELVELSQGIQRLLGPYVVSTRTDRPDAARLVHFAIRLAPRSSDSA